MSSADVAVKVFLQLETDDLRVLQVIETAMSQHEYVAKEQIAKFSRLDLNRDADFRIDRLSKLGLIYRIHGAYTGYTLNFAGYDCLAINGLVKGNILVSFGKPLGVGKEADVYDALDPEGKRVAVKFHRLGRISFRQTIRKRSYTGQHSAGWLYQSRLAAEREYEALKLLFPYRVAVPEPLAQNRHVVVMGMIEGAELADYQEIQRPERILLDVLRNVRKAYLKAGIIHADLSEYNIILKPNKRILIIDWPQYVKKEHPNAKELLTRDLKNILRYFSRKGNLKADAEEAFEYVTGIRRTITV